MEIYDSAIELLVKHSSGVSWPDMQKAFERAGNKRPVAWHFPVKACQAVGAHSNLAITAVAAISCVHMAIILIDDILDDDPRGEYLRIGAGRAANLAVGLNALGLELLLSANDMAEPKRLAAVTALNEMICGTANGQDMDVKNTQTEDGYWAVTRAKSSPYFGVALFLGALFGGAKLAIANQLKHLGEIYGEIMQIHDDLNDCLESPANIDWTSGRSPLPILFAQIVDHPERERFVQLRKQVADPALLEEAQSVLVRSGAISYSVHQLNVRHQRAEALLHQINLADASPLQELLDEAIAPVKNLFSSVGADFPAARASFLLEVRAGKE
jgi:geranylgeranyl pyrophosphate synthase